MHITTKMKRRSTRSRAHHSDNIFGKGRGYSNSRRRGKTLVSKCWRNFIKYIDKKIYLTDQTPG